MNKTRLIVGLFVSCMALTGQIYADQLTVDSTSDPAVGDPAMCTGGGSGNCTLRDALAAADSIPGMDSIVFDIKGAIYLNQKLIANEAVTIDGGGDTFIRINQGYNIAILPCLNIICGGPGHFAPTLQPAYFSMNGTSRPMLDLRGSGSVVTGITLDGSIVPDEGDGPVYQVDYASDGVTDTFLITHNSDGEDLWLVGGGIRAAFGNGLLCEDTPPQFFGTTNISGNRLKNLGINAIQLDYTFGAVISDNELSGGATCNGCYDGIFSYCSAALTVSDNRIDGFRNGIALLASSATTVAKNTTTMNGTGIKFEGMGDVIGPNLIEGNKASSNLQTGISASEVGASEFSNNVVENNGSDPNFHGGFLMKFSEENLITKNKFSGNSGFGIVLQTSQGNVVGYNKSKENGGAGIVLLNASNNNRIEFNKVKLNNVGILSTLIPVEPFPFFPFANEFTGNHMDTNSEWDLQDYDSACDDFWTDNKYVSAEGSCFN